MIPVPATLYDKIELKGAEDAAKILAAAEEKAAMLVDGVIKTAQGESAERLKIAERAAAAVVRNAVTQARQAAKRVTLERRKAAMDDVFDTAVGALAGLSDDAYAALVARFLKDEGLTGSETIRVSAREHARFARLFSSKGDLTLDLLSRRLGLKAGTLALDSEPAAIDGGLLVVGRDFDVDRSYRTVLSDLRDGLEPELAEILFGAGE
ncbi:MAG: V-type ATP synthase subunit E family protein [Candidatus Izemoplasmatales bacterium]